MFILFSKSESTSNYSDEAYWENRYKESKNPKQDVYEWYVSFDQIEATFKEDIANMSAGLNSLILVSGCGNSTLCEDFVNKGNLKYLRVTDALSHVKYCVPIPELI